MDLNTQKLMMGSASTDEFNNDFILTIDNAATGISEFGIALFGEVDCEIDWGDGTRDTIISPDNTTVYVRNYQTLGTYTIRISGYASRFGNGSSVGDSTSAGLVGIESLISVDQFGLGVTSLHSAFRGAVNLVSVPSSLPSTVTSLRNCFGFCTNFNDPNVISWDTSNVSSMIYIFQSATNFNQNISGWDTSKLTSMLGMFRDAPSFNQPIGSWDTSNVLSMAEMFYNHRDFNQDLSSWDTSKVVSTDYMFFTRNLEPAFNGSLNNWDVSSVVSMSFMFFGCRNFNKPLDNWNVSSVTNMRGTFVDCEKFNQPLNIWDTSSVESFRALFFGCSVFNQPLDNWVTSSVTDMYAAFAFCSVFNQNINSWDTSSVTHMGSLFENATNFNQPLNLWDVSNVVYMYSMFRNAINFNENISIWNTSSVIDMGLMFYADDINVDYLRFNQPLVGWDVSSVTNMRFMFRGARDFNQDLNSWNVSRVTDMSGMFVAASSFNKSLNSWDVGNVTDMFAMFELTTSYNQDISNWCVSNFAVKPDLWDHNSNPAWISKPVWGTCPLEYNFTAFFDPDTIYDQAAAGTPKETRLKWSGKNLQETVTYTYFNLDGSEVFTATSTSGQSNGTLNAINFVRNQTYIAGKASAISTIDGAEVVAYATLNVLI